MRKGIIIVLLCLPVWAGAQIYKDTLRVCLLLPLQTEAMQRDKSMDRFVDFYSGALLAVYEMQATGQPVKVHTYDVGKAVSKLDRVLSSGELDGMDMVIGPVYSNQVKRVSDWSRHHRVKVLLPFASEVRDLAYNPYLLQFNPSYALEADVVADYVVLHRPVHAILVEADSANVPASIRELQHSLKNYAAGYVYTTMSEVMADSLGSYLKEEAENLLLLNSERLGSLRAVLPHIEKAGQGKQLTLLSQYSWKDEQTGVPQLYTTVFNQQLDTNAYNQLYGRFYGSKRVDTHPCYDLLGYDLMGYALETVQTIHQTHGMMDEEQIVSRFYPGVQSDMQFERVGTEGGYQNTYIQWIKK